MILPLDKLDLKYRKSLVQIAQENEVDDPSVFRLNEDGYIQRWRQSAFQERFVRENDTELKQKLEELRIREYVTTSNLADAKLTVVELSFKSSHFWRSSH